MTYNSKLDFPRVLEDRWPIYLEENGRTPIRALAHRTALLTRLDLRPELDRIATRLLLVQGRDDRIVPFRYFEELRAALPQSESLLLPTVGHIPHVTHAELLARSLGEWLLPCPPEAGCTPDAATAAPPCSATGDGPPPCQGCPAANP